jgi:hypothetical protein
MTGVPAGLAGAAARRAPARALLAAAVTAVTTMRGALAVLAWLAGMIIRQWRTARRERARRGARRQPVPA